MNMNRLSGTGLRAIAVALVILLALSARVAAQVQDKPTIAVIGIEANPTPKISQQDKDAVAYELAVQLEESGCWRVLPREWLAAPADAARLPLAKLRAAAARAGVQYVVVGMLSRSSSRVPAQPPIVPHALPLPATWGVAMIGPRPAIGFRTAPSQTSVALRVEVIDAQSGDVVRTMTHSVTRTSNNVAEAAKHAAGYLASALTVWARTLSRRG